MKKDGCKAGEMLSGGVCIPEKCEMCKNYWARDYEPIYGGVNDEDRGYVFPDGTLLDMADYRHIDLGRALTSQKDWEDNDPNTMEEISLQLMKDCNLARFWVYEQQLELDSFKRPTEPQMKAMTEMLKSMSYDDFYALDAGKITDVTKMGRLDIPCVHRPQIAKLFDIRKWVEKCWP
jgi:hypothetical protein